MSETNNPGDVPSDLPPEYAEAYRRGYESARTEPGEAVDPDATQVFTPFGHDEPAPAPVSDRFEPDVSRTGVTGPLFADEEPAASGYGPDLYAPPSPAPKHAGPVDEPTQAIPRSGMLDGMLSAGSDLQEHPRYEEEDGFETSLRSSSTNDDYEEYDAPQRRWFWPVMLVVVVLVFLGGAYLVGAWLSGAFSSAPTTNQTTTGSSSTDSGGSGGGGSKESAKAYTGQVSQADVSNASASCTAPQGQDASGNPVSYAAPNVLDGDPSTAWRCDGSGGGQTLTLNVVDGQKVDVVGMIPGYAKTDPTSGEDRYAQNDRITKVRWTWANDDSVVQTLDGSAGNRSMQQIKLPKAESGTITVEILETVAGPRHTTAISEIAVGNAG